MVEKRSAADEQLERIAEAVLDQMGFELVELERAGHRARPILRLRVDRADAELDRAVTVDECARVSRELEEVLDAREDLATSYILEVSSPGVDRPLRKLRDYERSIGKEIAVRSYEPLAGGSKRLEGVLQSVERESLRLMLADGTAVDVPLSAVAKANLVFNWDEYDFGKDR
jgi:ribosome maturation factor RimP